MARETITRLVDDVDGGAAERTVVFGWDGKTYEIDLSKKNIASLEKVLKPFLSTARPVRGGASRPARRPARTAAAPTSGSGLQDVREWARNNGYPVANRGRVPAAVLAAFKAH